MRKTEPSGEPKTGRSLLPYACMTLASVIFGFSFLFTKKALSHLEIFQLLGIRFLTAAAVMTILAALRIVRVRYDRKKLLLILPVAVFQPVIYFICETVGIKLTTASESGMMIALIPIAVAVFSTWILKEKVTYRQWAAILTAFMGVVLIVATKGLALSFSYFLGYVLLIGAVVSAGLFNPLSRKASSVCTPFEITFMMIWVGALVFNSIGLFIAGSEGRIGRYITDALSPDVLTGILYLGLLSSIVAFFCLNYAYSKIRSGVSASFANLTTVLSVLAGVALNGESLYWLQLAGAVLVLAGIWGVTKGGTEKSEGKLKFIVESERLYLRLLEPGDTTALMRVWGDPEVMKYCGGAATEDRIRQIIQTDRENYKKYGNTIFAVMEKASGKLIGIVGCKIAEKKPRQGELIAHFAKDAWGKGYATEIIKAYIEWNKKHDLLDYIFASVMPENAISLNMAKKAGFKQNGFVQFEDTGYVDEPFFEIFLF